MAGATRCCRAPRTIWRRARHGALLALVAKHFGVAKRDVTLVAGQTARLKRLTIAGDPQVLARAAASLYAVEP